MALGFSELSINMSSVVSKATIRMSSRMSDQDRSIVPEGLSASMTGMSLVPVWQEDNRQIASASERMDLAWESFLNRDMVCTAVLFMIFKDNKKFKQL